MPTKDTETKRRSVSHLSTQNGRCLHGSRWDDDVVFRNQARGTENKGKKEFVNVCSHALGAIADYADWYHQDLLRSDFHKRFMVSSC